MDKLVNELLEATEAILELRKREYTHTGGEPVRFNEWDVAYKNLETALNKIKEAKDVH